MSSSKRAQRVVLDCSEGYVPLVDRVHSYRLASDAMLYGRRSFCLKDCVEYNLLCKYAKAEFELGDIAVELQSGVCLVVDQATLDALLHRQLAAASDVTKEVHPAQSSARVLTRNARECTLNLP